MNLYKLTINSFLKIQECSFFNNNISKTEKKNRNWNKFWIFYMSQDKISRLKKGDKTGVRKKGKR